MIYLTEVLSGRTRDYPIAEGLCIMGWEAGVDIVLTDAGLPGISLKLHKQSEHISILNLENHSQIYLNGKKFKNASLTLGDQLKVGSQIFYVNEKADPEFSHPVPDIKTSNQKLRKNLLTLADEINGESSLPKLLSQLITLILNEFGGKEGFIFTLSDSAELNQAVSAGGENCSQLFSDTIIQEVIRTKSPLHIPNALSDPKYGGSQSIMQLKIHSAICYPIIWKGAIRGVIYLGNHKPGTKLEDFDSENFGIYISLAALLLQNFNFIENQRKEIASLKKGFEENLVGDSQAFKKLLSKSASLAASDISILLEGETGTGKEEIAKYIHKKSPRIKGPFIAINCSAFKNELLESELFGYKKGAFTGALTDKPGLFQAANGGTLFLDEIGEMELSLQAKLLRVLETQKIRPLGSIQEIPINFRVVSATNRDLKFMIQSKEFREDLYYRLAQITLTLPPLRERQNDAVLLSRHFFHKLKGKYPHLEKMAFPDSAEKLILSYSWPGNIRELYNVIHRSLLTSENEELKLDIGIGDNPDSFNFEEQTKKFQKDLLAKTLDQSLGNKERAAKTLGMSRSTFFRYLSQLEVE